MVFGYWAIFTAAICLIGFTYMTVVSFSEDSVETPNEAGQDNSDSETAHS